jgi:hypothetical protein
MEALYMLLVGHGVVLDTHIAVFLKVFLFSFPVKGG